MCVEGRCLGRLTGQGLAEFLGGEDFRVGAEHEQRLGGPQRPEAQLDQLPFRIAAVALGPAPFAAVRRDLVTALARAQRPGEPR